MDEIRTKPTVISEARWARAFGKRSRRPIGEAPIIYVAGPYSAPTPEQVQANVDAAIDAGNRLLDAGLRVRVPHLSHYQHARRERGYEFWMEVDFAELRDCHALLRIGGESSGAEREVALARRLCMPVFHDEAEVIAWGKDWTP